MSPHTNLLNKKRRNNRWFQLFLVCLLAVLAILTAGCGRIDSGQELRLISPTAEEAQETAETQGKNADEQDEAGQSGDVWEDDTGDRDPSLDEPPASEEQETGLDAEGPEEPPAIAEDGSYTSAEDVALYLHTYGHLPDNFMTKKEARALGWNGGSVEDYAPGMCIGGDRYGNYEGLLPDGSYHECDIDTLGKSKRGAKRLVFDDRGNIYYTKDHYQSFTLLYGEE